MAHANQHTKALKAKRSDAAKRAWVTIRANRAAAEASERKPVKAVA